MELSDTISFDDYGFILCTDTQNLRILQLTDTQIIDSSQMRTPNRLNPIEIAEWAPKNTDQICYNVIRESIEKTKPHLIIFTGDLIYGEFDDNGTNFRSIVSFLDSFKIPWAPVFGNHDNETVLGVGWQCEQLEKAKYCLFKRGNTVGNGNYTVTFKHDSKPFRRLFMLDSNCMAGISEQQVNWMENALKDFSLKDGESVPFFTCFHVPCFNFSDAAVRAGYQPTFDTAEKIYYYNIGVDTLSKNMDFGSKLDVLGGKFHIGKQDEHFTYVCKKYGCDGMFAGHCHNINTSIFHNGIRYTHGLKSSFYDYFAEDCVGSTLITLTGFRHGEFKVEHIYTNYKYGQSLRYKKFK